MSNTVVTVDNISKRYRLGTVGTRSLLDDLSRWWYAARGLGSADLENDVQDNGNSSRSSSYIWALKNVSFDVRQGEILGIIGRNGAGKSTILKILSRITAPTRGEIKIKGRIASLLEVGTGFHPELSGRENIFLNGALMGMTKEEISSKFDEIVNFSGVEAYIHTPVKRYSSGMYVRLAFAVAAHLEPEILIMDEVLAVGDADFQKKCLGKMRDVSHGDGRTVLFVSHNMTAIRSLCDRALLLEEGKVTMNGDVDSVVNGYLGSVERQTETQVNAITEDNAITIKTFQIKGLAEDGFLKIDKSYEIETEIVVHRQTSDRYNVNLCFKDREGTILFILASSPQLLEEGEYIWKAVLPAHFFNDIAYSIDLRIAVKRSRLVLNLENIISFEGIEPPRDSGWMGKYPGFIRPKFIEWKIARKVLL